MNEIEKLGTDLFDEIIEKYCANYDECDQNTSDGRWEMRGFDSISQKQSQIFRLQCIVLARSNVSHLNRQRLSPGKCFSLCKELDLTRTKVIDWRDIIEMLTIFPNLKILRLDYNKIRPLEEFISQYAAGTFSSLPKITHLSMNCCALSNETANMLPILFDGLLEIYLAENSLKYFSPTGNCSALRLIDIQANPIKSFENIKALSKLPSLETLNLCFCEIEMIDFTAIFGEDIGFANLQTLLLQENPLKNWLSIDSLALLPALKKLNVRGVPLPGARGVDFREICIAKLPKLIDLDKCDISAVERRSAELLFFSRFSTETPEEHRQTVERLNEIYGEPKDFMNGKQNFNAKINAKRIQLRYKEKIIDRELSLALPINKIVGVASRFLDFDPDTIEALELRRNVDGGDYPPEKISRTRDNLLRQYDLEDGDAIVFL